MSFISFFPDETRKNGYQKEDKTWYADGKMEKIKRVTLLISFSVSSTIDSECHKKGLRLSFEGKVYLDTPKNYYRVTFYQVQI